MIKKPFFGLGKPKLKYSVIEKQGQDSIKEIPLPDKVTLFLRDADIKKDDLVSKVGDKVKTGQKLMLIKESKAYLISTVTGTITAISDYTDYLDKIYPTISIDVAQENQQDDEFNKTGKTPTAENALEFLNCLPGNPDFTSLLNIDRPLNTIIINGMDKDLLITTNQIVVKTESENLKKGVEILKKITGISRIIIIVPPNLTFHAVGIDAEVKKAGSFYPDTSPQIVLKKILGIIVPQGEKCEDMGVGFINAEAVAALAKAYDHGKLPLNKLLTVIKKDSSTVNVRARIGTPVKDILSALNIEINHGDRLVFGGPMTGHAVYSGETPALSDTDAIMVQDKGRIVLNSDTQCINCGECIRACPVNIPVNMLIRLLENGLYEEAVDDYDLLSCIECGLCSYVCTARIPVFHYIMFGKHEFTRIKGAEESNA